MLLALEVLERVGYRVSAERVQSETELRRALDAGPWDVVLSDFSIPGFGGLQALEIVMGSRLDLPFIFISGVLGEERAVAAMRAGARDYVLKGNLPRLGPAVRREVADHRNREQRTQAEQALELEQHRFQNIFATAAIGLIEVDITRLVDALPAGPVDKRLDELARLVDVRDANQEALRLLETDRREDVVGTVSGALTANGREALRSVLTDLVNGASGVQREMDVETLRGTTRRFLVSMRFPKADQPHRLAVIGLLDVTERYKLEQAFHKSQRMDALGRLAAGVAHDFNNLITVVVNSAQLVRGALREDQARTKEDVASILEATGRASALTNQLLAFSSEESRPPEIVDPNESLRRMHRMVSRIITETIDFRLDLADQIEKLRIDPLQFDQIVLNLVINARDAMPNGGTLIVSTKMCSPPPDANIDDRCICLTVTDTGVGMGDDTRARVFEPFFTTKAPGVGTGLGLATTYGIVKRAKGHIALETAPGAGTTFTVYLPATRDVSVPKISGAQASTFGGSETILVVEDQDMVLRTVQRVLERWGYKVLAARSAKEAIDVLSSSSTPIHLVMSDVVMPGMSGLELRTIVREKFSGAGFLLTSGYTGEGVPPQLFEQGMPFLPKPFSQDDLLRKVRELLDSPK
jgi:signal transduction histidine kinase